MPRTVIRSVLFCTAILSLAGCGKPTVDHEVEHPAFLSSSPIPVATPTPSPNSSVHTPVPTLAVSPSPSPTPAPELTFVPASDASPTSPPLNSVQVSAPVHPQKLFVVIAGNGTCNPSEDSQTLPHLWRTDTFEYFIDEVMNRGMVAPQDEVLFFCYENFSPKMSFYSLRHSPYMQPVDQTEVDAVVLQHANNIKQLIIIGYSYGAWRSMKLASAPDIIANIPGPYLLATIDPISKVTCTRMFGSGCHEAPKDFFQQEMGALGTHTKWINLFQTSGILLSSGTEPYAQNYIIDDANHLDMPSNTDVWHTIVLFMEQNLLPQ